MLKITRETVSDHIRKTMTIIYVSPLYTVSIRGKNQGVLQ